MERPQRPATTPVLGAPGRGGHIWNQLLSKPATAFLEFLLRRRLLIACYLGGTCIDSLWTKAGSHLRCFHPQESGEYGTCSTKVGGLVQKHDKPLACYRLGQREKRKRTTEMHRNVVQNPESREVHWSSRTRTPPTSRAARLTTHSTRPEVWWARRRFDSRVEKAAKYHR